MHRRGLVPIFGFLVAIVVAGGGGVSAPWSPSADRPTPVAIQRGTPARTAVMQTRMRAE